MSHTSNHKLIIRADNRIGCHCWGTNAASIAALDECADIGVGWVRATRPMQIETVTDGRGQYNWERAGEHSVNNAIAHGMSVLGILDGRWGFETKVNKLSWCSPIWEHLDDWCDFVTAAVTRYRDRVKHWEVLNEPPFFWWYPLAAGERFPDVNGHMKRASVRHYAEFLKATARTIRACDPEAIVVAGSTFGDGLFLRQLYELDCRDFFDVASVHYMPCHHPEEFERSYNTLRNLMTEHGDSHKPLWDTESGPGGAIIGQSVDSPGDYDAIYNIYRHCMAHQFGLERYFWFNSVPSSPDAPNGLRVREKDGNLGPSYQAMRVLIEQVGDGALLGHEHPEGEVHLYIFAGPKGPVSILWSTANATVQLGNESVATDSFGRSIKLPSEFPLSGKPLYFEGDLRSLDFKIRIEGSRETVRLCMEDKRPVADTPVLASTRVAQPLELDDPRWEQIPVLATREQMPVKKASDHFCAVPAGLPAELSLAHDEQALHIRCRIWDDLLDRNNPSALLQFTLRDSDPTISEWPFFLNSYALFNLHISRLGSRFLRYEHMFSDIYRSGVVPNTPVMARVSDDCLVVTASIPWKSIGPCRTGKSNPFLGMFTATRCDELLDLPEGDDPAEWSHNFVDPFIVRSPSLKAWINFR